MLIGIVGKPSCGKSTFFKAVTLADVAIASYSFTTIKPNRGVGYVRVKCSDRDLGVQCNPRFGYCKDGTRYVPVELLDVAGLVPGAHEGKGLGNQFLNDLNQADVLVHIVDASGMTNERGEATTGYDPVNDVRFLEEEIDLWYLGILKKGWDKLARTAVQTKEKTEATLVKQMGAFRVTDEHVKDVMHKTRLHEKTIDKWTEEELKTVATELRKKTKPILIAANKMDMPDSEKNLERLRDAFPSYTIIACAADAELALREAAKRELVEYHPGEGKFETKKQLNTKQKEALDKIQSLLARFGSTGVQDVLDRAVFDFLKYIAIFPGGIGKLEDSEGRVMPDCFLMPPGTTAYDFAARIHTDFAKNFLYAMDVRTRQRIGREHALKHGDVVEIISAAK
ncbi:MAG: redox-regulated ATPase YchF [Candidatus Aenigmatarchaeota archaeon]|nr:MAG: redox-regulated ATPase YchF [Candidatus Aenigmarchaeota archaeon]